MVRVSPSPATRDTHTHGSTALLNVAVCQTKLQRACAGDTAGVAAPLPGLLAHKGSAGLRRCSVEGGYGGSSRYSANRLAQTAVTALCHPAVFHFECCCHGPKIEQWREVQVKVGVCVCVCYNAQGMKSATPIANVLVKLGRYAIITKASTSWAARSWLVEASHFPTLDLATSEVTQKVIWRQSRHVKYETHAQNFET